jgi:hypothetical protein
MKQIVHIFRKDVRHHWLEIVVALAVLAAFTWNEPIQWTARELRETGIRGVLTGLLNVLVVVSWWLLIVRVVQSEALVGDRQFWVTRPYEWKKLLAAKVLFVVAFVNIPLLIADMILLVKASFGLAPSFVPRLLGMQLVLVTLLILPIAALATVTASVGQMVLALLAIGAYIAGVAALASYVPSASFSSGSEGLQAAILIGACLAVVVWQYARRRTNKSRALLVGAAAAILIIVVATPYRTLVAHEYPLAAAGQQQLVQLALDPEKPPAPDIAPDREKIEKSVEIRLPLTVSGIAEGAAVSVDGAMLTVQSPDGLRWNSGWKRSYLHVLPNQPRSHLDFEMKKDFFEIIKSTAVKAHISLALTAFHEKDAKQIVATDGEFAVPDVGLCSIEPEYSSSSVRCRYPFRAPSLLTTIASSTTTCAVSADESVPEGKTAHDWSGNTDAGPISPVGTINLYFWRWDGDEDYKTSPAVCPGTPLVVSMQEEGPHTRIELEAGGLHLADYRTSNFFNVTLRAPTKHPR